ncbi:MAG TPA: nuclear transport factor 2 family protein [Pseudomonadales bacterium]|jgi:ketosteroid isomerase-like protein
MAHRDAELLVRGFFHAVSSGDTEWIAAHFSQQGYYSVEGKLAAPNVVTRNKLENVIASVIKQFPAGLEFSVATVLVDDDRAAAEVEILGMHETGHLVDTHYLFLFAFHDGKIDHIKEYAASEVLTRQVVGEEFWGHQ